VGFPPTNRRRDPDPPRLFTPEEAEIALELSLIPEPAGTIHKRLKSKMGLAELSQALAHAKTASCWPFRSKATCATQNSFTPWGCTNAN